MDGRLTHTAGVITRTHSLSFPESVAGIYPTTTSLTGGLVTRQADRSKSEEQSEVKALLSSFI